MMKTYDVIVVGAGAAGLMAAGEAASCGAKTLLLEKMDQPGRKIYISGKFRCNITNTAPIPEFINHFGKDGRFLRQAFHQFFSDDLLTFFHQKGVATIEERGGRIFPASGQSKDVVDALVNWGKNQGVTLNIYTPVVKLISENDQILGVETPKTAYQARNVIITTGGASYPGTGSTGDGYNLAALAGHTIIPVRPALVPLLTDGDTAQRLQGLSLRNVSVSIWVNQKKIDQAFGEMLFTHFGVSGPIILSMSKIVVDALADGEKVMLSLDLKPALDDKKLDARILRDFNQHGKQHFQTFLNDLLPQKLIPVCIDLTGIPGDRLCHQITSEQRKKLRTWIKDFRLNVSGHRGFRHAIITAGGVSTQEIHPKTMESKIRRGLYFAGEVLDIDADTGGYNLQAAFSTGWLAGRSAGQSISQSTPAA